MHRDFLKELDCLKTHLEEGDFSSEREFFEAFESLFVQELRHNRCEVDPNFDWMHLTHLHIALMDRVAAIHEVEEDELNRKVLESCISTEEAFSKFEEGKRGQRIYLLGAENTEYDLIGDLHGDPISLMEIVRRTSLVQNALNGNPHKLVFMGDYVDRGKAHLSIMGRLLALKYCLPDRIILLRGNHDGGIYLGPKQVKLPYRKYDEEPEEDYFPTYLIQLSKVHPETEPLLKAYMTFFDTLGQFALIRTGKVITMAVHGGIPRPILTEEGYFTYLESLSVLSDSEHMDPFGRTMTQNLMWSDPYLGEGELREGMGRYYFTEEQFLDFIETIGVHQMLRGHEWMDAGFRKHFNGRLYTIFSSGQWPNNEENPLTAYPTVHAKWARLTANGTIDIRPKRMDSCC